MHAINAKRLKPFTKTSSLTSTTIHLQTPHITTNFHIPKATIELHRSQQIPTATYTMGKINQLINSTQLLNHLTRSRRGN